MTWAMTSFSWPSASRAIWWPRRHSKWCCRLVCDQLQRRRLWYRRSREVGKVAMAVWRGLRRHPLVVVNALLLVGVAMVAAWRYTPALWADSPVPADLFMQSVATEDGGLGWSQLCP